MTRFGATAVAVLLFGSTFVSTPGCQESLSVDKDFDLRKNPRRAEAQQRWTNMRAKVKLQLAQETFRTNQLEAAFDACLEVLSLEPTSVDAQLLMARIRLERGEIAKAEDMLDQASGVITEQQLEGYSAELLFLRGMMAERRDDLEEATELYAHAHVNQPDNVDYLLTYGHALVRQDRLTDALRVLEPRLPDYERDAAVHLLMAQILSLLERPSEAANYYATALQLAPEDELIREEAVTGLLEAGRTFQAMQALRPLLESPETCPSTPVLHKLATSLMMKGQVAEAAALLEPALEARPDDALLWRTLGQAHLRAEKMAEAGSALRRSLRLEPSSIETRLLLAYQALAVGETGEAIQLAQSVVDDRPEDAEAQALLDSARAIQNAKVDS
jgi:Tfp pilus assembly protein PilF